MARADELRAVFQQFFSETRHAFAFLERAYGYRHVDEALDSHSLGIRGESHYVRAAESHYVRACVGVGVQLEASVPDVAVSFVALPQPDVYLPGAYFPEAYPEWPRAIELLSLAHMLGHQDDPDICGPTRAKNRRCFVTRSSADTQRSIPAPLLGQQTWLVAAD